MTRSHLPVNLAGRRLTSLGLLATAWLTASWFALSSLALTWLATSFLLPATTQAAEPLANGKLPGWQFAASLWIDTTKTGVELDAKSVVEDFPLLVRLQRDTFDFRQAQPGGTDIRFTSHDGQPLAHQLDHWNPDAGEAAFWVKIPRISGATRQELRLHWGNPRATSPVAAPTSTEKDRPADLPNDVFQGGNGFLSVWHLEKNVQDATGSLQCEDRGTQDVAGIIGSARKFAGGQGICGGEKIASYPTAATHHSTSVWFRATRPNSTLIAWGNEQAQGKVVMQFRSPPHIRMDCYFSGGNVASEQPLPRSEWTHVVHTYREGVARLYINGQLADENARRDPPLRIQTPARLFLGGWYHNYDYHGELDEVRVAKVERSADWVRLEYESQRPDARLVGHPVQPGDRLEVTPKQLTVKEGQAATVTARAEGAQRVYWELVRGGQSRILSTNRWQQEIAARRVVGEQQETLRLHAVYPDRVRTVDVPITISDSLPEPMVQLAPIPRWDGRATLRIEPQITNRAALEAAGVGQLNLRWTLDGVATSTRDLGTALELRRAQGSGPLKIEVAVDNGGPAITAATQFVVTQPPAEREPWVARPSKPTEQPVDGQFIPRDGRGSVKQSPSGTLVYKGQLTEQADAVFVRLYADDKLLQTKTAPVDKEPQYEITLSVPAALVKYRTEMGVRRGEQETIRHRASDLLCGDVLLICGQSNAVATDFGAENNWEPSEWVRSFGATDGSPQGSRLEAWLPGQARSPGGKGEIGYWGLELGRRLVEQERIPICFINGAVGGTRIDQHQRSVDDPTDVQTIYGRLLWRVRAAGLSHGVRAIIWHQGENDQGADGPTGGYGYETYRQFFLDLAASWRDDYPNVEHYYAFQIWPKACAMGINGSDNRLREVQRNLPRWFSNLTALSTVGIKPPGGCHYPAAGYAEFARLLQPHLARDLYGARVEQDLAAPNLIRATFSNATRDAIQLEFDSPVVWDDKLQNEFSLDGKPVRIVSGTTAGRQLTLRLAAPTDAQQITYLDSKNWNPDRLLLGTNGLAAFTFCEVPLERAP
ncbi:MAG: DUF2341 domain-containing protein [Planctomycetota bacterium]